MLRTAEIINKKAQALGPIVRGVATDFNKFLNYDRQLASLVDMITGIPIDERCDNEKKQIGAFIDNGDAGNVRLE